MPEVINQINLKHMVNKRRNSAQKKDPPDSQSNYYGLMV